MPERLPIDAVLPELVTALRGTASVVLRAPTGAGKTTRVPPALLDAGLAGDKKIVVLEPRRIAARAAAQRIADERAGPGGRGKLGDEIGFHVRFDRQAGPRTRVLTVTPGILLRYLQDDPFLESVGVLVFDEFHERGLESDLALGMARLIQQTVRPDLKLVVMSATLDVLPIAGYLGDCPVVVSEGRLYPVEIRHESRPEARPVSEMVAASVATLLDQTPGDILVFLPGVGEIRQAERHLERLAADRKLAVVSLYGDLPADQQDAALRPQGRRKVVLSTNVAETSVTVEGVTAVIDSGLARQLVYDPSVGLDRLELVPIARDSAAQRAGRAGRTRPGVCVRLWSPIADRSRADLTEPEVRRADLAGVVLQLLSLGETDVWRFPWLEPPPDAAITQSLLVLERLGAVTTTPDRTITELGRTLGRLPAHPRLGRLLLEGARLGALDRAALTAALLSERDPFRRSDRHQAAGETVSDVLDRVEALEAFEQKNREGDLHPATARQILRARDQFVRAVRQEAQFSRGAGESSGIDPDEAVQRALLAAFPDRLARRREPGSRRGLMVGGRGVRLAPSSGVIQPELFVCIETDAGDGEAWVRQASGVQRDWLSAELTASPVLTVFDTSAEKVVSTRQLRFLDLVIDETSAALPEPARVAEVLSAAAARHLDRVLPADDSPAGHFLARLRWLKGFLPDADLPGFGPEDAVEILGWLCPGRKSFAELRQAPWLDALRARLTQQQRQFLDREAPEEIEVPTGSRITLKYEPGRPPVLAVRIQELFGLAETPRLAGGRVRVLLHLLGPNYRPQQVTDDLASFWANTYPQVRKDLRARYPKHAWPEDPRNATPERRPRRRPGG